MKNMKLKNIVALATTTLLIAPSAFGASGKGREAKEEQKGAIGTTTTGQARKQAVTALVSRVDAAGLLGKTSKQALESRLENSLVKVESFKRNKDNSKSQESISLQDILQDLSARSKDLTNEQRELASQIIEALSNERSGTQNEHLNKLLVEANALLQPGVKATEGEMKSFAEKLTKMNEMVVRGEVKNLDQAANKVLTEKEKKDLENCIRG